MKKYILLVLLSSSSLSLFGQQELTPFSFKRFLQCLQQPAKYNCSEEELKTTKKWVIEGIATGGICIVSGAAGYMLARYAPGGAPRVCLATGILLGAIGTKLSTYLEEMHRG